LEEKGVILFKPIDFAKNIPFNFSITEAEEKSLANIVAKEGADGSSQH